MQYLRSDNSPAGARHLAQAKGKSLKLESAPVEATSIYAFNLEGGGYIIASADSRTLPVLGYSTTGIIDWEQMPDNMRFWLKKYDDAVATLGNRTDLIDGYPAGARSVSPYDGWKRVEPLIKTVWYQKAPYSNQCPLYQGDNPEMAGQRCLTGCVATALAQVLNYYRWPKSLPYGLPDYVVDTYYNGNKKEWHIDALPPVSFDYDNMLDDYLVPIPGTDEKEIIGTEVQQNAVATLMRYCGQAVQMDYTPKGSGASTLDLYHAFIDYLDYPSATVLQKHPPYTINEYDSIIYAEVAAQRPVVLTGFDNDGGHCFVCDGYDTDGMFHINWGWDGSHDGYFSLAVLNPYDNTPGGGSSEGYCDEIAAVIHLDPHMEKQPEPKGKNSGFYQNEGIEVNDNLVSLYFYYFADADVVADNALGVIGDDGSPTPVMMGDVNDSIVFCFNIEERIRNIFDIEVDSTAFQPGDTLRLYPLIRLRQPGAQWQVMPPVSSHVVAGRNPDGEFFCFPTDLYQLEFEGEPSLKGTGLIGNRTEVKFHIKNLTDDDYSEGLWLLPVYYGHFSEDEITEQTPAFDDGWIRTGAYIRAGETDSISFSFIPRQSGVTKFHLWTDRYYIGFQTLILPYDTIANYNAYIDNNSYLTNEEGQWIYKAELCDKRGVRVPYWVPSDNIGFMIRHYIDDDLINEISLRDEIKDYLKLLPENAGNGEYKFTYPMPINISRNGRYKLVSFMGEWDGNVLTDNNCTHEYEFQISTANGIIDLTTSQNNKQPAMSQYYDLQGRRIKSKPAPGLYIVDGKKVFLSPTP